MDVFDFHYYSAYDEIRSIMHLPNFAPFSAVPLACDGPEMIVTSSEQLSGGSLEVATSNSILAEYLQPNLTLTQYSYRSVAPHGQAGLRLLEVQEVQEVQSDGIVPYCNDILLGDLVI